MHYYAVKYSSVFVISILFNQFITIFAIYIYYGMSKWNELSLRERADLINTYLDGGVLDLKQMKEHYNSFGNGRDKSYSPSQSIKDYIKKTEAFRSGWYKDGNGVPTVGYGFTGDYFKKKYPNGMTREEADKEFDRVIQKFALLVKQHTPNYDSLSQNQKDSLLSYMYNVGPGNYTTKSPKFQKALRDKDWNAVAQNMDIGYNDQKNKGLRKRRDYERALFLGNSSMSSSPSVTQYYDDYKAQSMASPVPPEAGQTPPIGMPSLYYNPTVYKDVDFSTPLTDFNYPGQSFAATPSSSRRRTAAVTQPSSIPTNEEIIGNLFGRLDSMENVFEEGGDTASPIGKPLYWNPGSAENTQIPLRAYELTQSKPSRAIPELQLAAKAKSAEQQAFMQNVLDNLDTSKITEQLPTTEVEQNDVFYKPVDSRVIEAKVLGDSDKKIVQDIVRNLKSEDDIKQLQKELYEKGYLKAETPKIKAKTKDEIKELQRKLKDAGYDIGNSGKDKDGVDGIIGSKTRAAWEKYSKEHADEAAIDSVVDGKMGRATMAAAAAYYKGMSSEKESIAEDSPEDPYALSVQMYRNIPTVEKVSSLVGTTIPSHVGAFANKAQLSFAGRKEGIEDYDAYVADEIEAASEALSAAKKSGNEDRIVAAKERVAAAREKLKTNRLNRSRLSNAEKKAAMAILTGINGGRQMTYDDYMSNINLIGGEDGNYLGSNPRHKHKKFGKDVMLYDSRSGYHVMNEAENSRGGMEDREAHNSWLGNVFDAEKRIYEDPNRGRLGAFSYYVDSNGDIHIYDRLEATEKKAARGANDKANYNAARDFFPRSSTSEMRDVITAEEYKNYIEKVLRKEKRKSKKE